METCLFGIAQPNSSPWECSVIKFLMGKLKFKGRNRGIRREMCAGKGFCQVFAFHTKIFWSSSVWAKCWNLFQLWFLRVHKTLCPFGINSTQNQVALGAWAVRWGCIPVLQSCTNADLWIVLGGGGRKWHRGRPSTPLICNCATCTKCFIPWRWISWPLWPAVLCCHLGHVVPKDKPPLLIPNMLE